jgi:hypothetical protein
MQRIAAVPETDAAGTAVETPIMQTSSLTLLLFTAFSGLRIFAYLPQILRVARDTNGASAISYSTWILWTGANIATALYALANLGDVYLACVSAVYAACCITVIGLTVLKRRHAAEASIAPWQPRSVEPQSLGVQAALPYSAGS